jgi:predicted DNA binding CopG/RHH family protein
MELKIVDNADISREELEHFEKHDFGKEMAEGLKDGSTVVSDGSWEETVRAIKAKKARNASRMTSFRLPVWVIEGLKRNAARGGVKYSEYAVEVLSKAAR